MTLARKTTKEHASNAKRAPQKRSTARAYQGYPESNGPGPAGFATPLRSLNPIV